MLAAVDTEGRPGLAWRAQHAAQHASATTRRTRRAARREAKLAAQSGPGAPARLTSERGRAAAPATTLAAMIEPWPAPCVDAPVHATVRLPGSKSQTNRALVLAALARTPEHRWSLRWSAGTPR